MHLGVADIRYTWQMKTGRMQRLRENVQGAMKAENRSL